jgi:hypothetical protein
VYSSTHSADRLANHLAYFDGISLADQSLAGGADMLLKRNHHARRLRRFHDGQTSCNSLSALSLMRMKTAGKTVYGTHVHSSFLNKIK